MPYFKTVSRTRAALLAATACIAIPATAAAPRQRDVPKDVRVVTYHYDNLRTGWNFSEEILTPKTVSSSQFKLLKSVPEIGKALVARGAFSAAGVLEANAILHAKNNPAMWYPDR